MPSELQLFVREALGRGLPRPAIREQLLGAGWRAEEVDAALDAYAESDFPVPVPRRRPYLSAREAFLYLVLFATLYITTYNCGRLLFLVIERAFPDPLREPAMSRYGSEALRGATAAIVIAFPIFLGLSRHIGGMLAREPEKRGSPIRKWLTYITLFLAALVIIGDLIVLVTRLLGGEVAPRFLLKVATVFVIAAAVFGHYLGDLRRDESEAAGTARRRTLGARLSAAGVVAVMVLGLVYSGAPSRTRVETLDLQRVEDLRGLAGLVESHYFATGALPASLEEAMGPTRQMRAADPVTREPYVYTVRDSTTYQLCAVFAAASGPVAPEGGASADIWRHGPGRQCFTFHVRGGAPDKVPPPRP